MTPLSIRLAIEYILGNGPMNEPSDSPTTYDERDAFNEGHTRGWWEACQMLELVLKAIEAEDEAMIKGMTNAL